MSPNFGLIGLHLICIIVETIIVYDSIICRKPDTIIGCFCEVNNTHAEYYSLFTRVAQHKRDMILLKMHKVHDTRGASP